MVLIMYTYAGNEWVYKLRDISRLQSVSMQKALIKPDSFKEKLLT